MEARCFYFCMLCCKFGLWLRYQVKYNAGPETRQSRSTDFMLIIILLCDSWELLIFMLTAAQICSLWVPVSHGTVGFRWHPVTPEPTGLAQCLCSATLTSTSRVNQCERLDGMWVTEYLNNRPRAKQMTSELLWKDTQVRLQKIYSFNNLALAN